MIEREDSFFARMNVKLYDDKRIVLGLDCGQIYAGTSSIARDLPVLNGNCHIQEITVNDDLVFLKGFIHVEVPIADEVILDSYDFKVLAKSKLLAEYAIVSGHYYVTN